MSNYIDWVKENWQKSAVLVLVYLVIILIPLFSRLDLIEFMILLPFPLYLIHEIEEYILPGGFPKFFNENLLKVDFSNEVLPVDREVIFWINIIYVWRVIPIFSGLGFMDLRFAAWIPYFLFFQGLGHLVMGIVGKMVINPGIRSSLFIFIPYSIYGA